MLLLLCFTSSCLLTAAPVSAVTMETVVGVAGRNVTLPCRSEAAGQSGVEVCWGRGQPSLFTCHNAVISTAGGQVTYRKSHRFWSSSSSLSIGPTRHADAGLYHCRVQLPGLFNDRTVSVLLIILTSRSEAETLNAPHTAAGGEQTGSDVTNTTRPMVALVQSSEQQVDSLHSFITNTLRVSFIIFIPAVLLTAAYRVWRTNQRAEPGGRLNQSEQESSWV